MPDKDGDDEKTTKGVVKKKTKQMLNQEYIPEEEYDRYRDNILMRGGDHRSKETRERSYTPTGKQPKGDTPMQKEFKKKYGKKATALDAVKQKYKGQIMNVGKKSKKKANEELDLTKIAEAFGGYIVEETSEEKRKKLRAKFGKDQTPKEIRQIKKDEKDSETLDFSKDDQPYERLKGGSLDGADAKDYLDRTTQGIPNLTPDQDRALAATMAGRDIEAVEKMNPDTKRALRKQQRGEKTRLEDDPEQVGKAGPIKISNVKDEKPKRIRTIPFKRKPTYSPEVEKQIDRIKKEISQRDTKKKKDKDIRDIINPDKRKKPAYVSTSSPEFGEPETIKNYPSTPLFFTNRPKGVRDTGTGLSKSFKDFGKEIDSYGDRLKAFRKDFDKIKPQKDRVYVPPKPEPEKKPKVEPQTQTQTTVGGDGGKKPPKVSTSTGATGGGKEPSLVSKVAKFSKENPATALLSLDALRRFMPSSSPFGVSGGRVGRRSAPS